jgi:signal peptidase I
MAKQGGLNRRDRWLLAICFFLIITFVATRTVAFQVMQAPSSSMEPNIKRDDFVYVNDLAYGLRLPFIKARLNGAGRPKRGDVAIFRYPADTSVSYVKRIIGLPGDRVEYRKKQLIINGVAAKTTLVAQGSEEDNQAPGFDLPHQTLLLDEVLDGRRHLIQQFADRPGLMLSAVRPFEGQSACRYDEDGFVCQVPQGRYLALGDNRDNSNDGRYWGFISDDLLVGRVTRVLFNAHDASRAGLPVE